MRPGQLGLDVGLAAAEHHRLQPAAQFGEVLVVDRPAALVELVEVAVEAEQRPDQFGVEVLDDRIELVDAVLDRRAGQHEGIGRAQRFHPPRGLDLPVLDALRLVEHDHVGMQYLVDVRGVAEHLLVVHDGEECGLAVGGKARRPGPEHGARRAVGETCDLLLPLRLERGRAHHQHALDALAAGQELAGGDRLDGLAEAHLVGQQGPLAECEMQHAFALIGQQRMVQQIETRSAVLDLGEECRARLFARALPAQPVEPRREMARHPNPAADVGGRNAPRGNKRLNLARIASKCAIRFNERSKPAACRVRTAAVARGPHQCRRRSAAAIQEDLDARSASGGGLAERPGAALAQSREHALDVLARPEAIGAMIDAAAGIAEAIEVADFHLVEAAAPRLHTERAEKWLIGFQRLDGDDFGAAAPAAQRDLVLVGGPPALQRRRAIEHSASLGRRGALQFRTPR